MSGRGSGVGVLDFDKSFAPAVWERCGGEVNAVDAESMELREGRQFTRDTDDEIRELDSDILSSVMGRMSTSKDLVATMGSSYSG